MNQGKYVFAQLMAYIPRYEFQKAVTQYKGNYKVKSFRCWYQFLCLCFGQLTHREGLRDIVICLNAHRNKLYHLGIKATVARSTLAKANEVRDWRIYAATAMHLINQARVLYRDNNDFSLELDNAVYALDASTVDLCLNVFKWAKFRRNKGAIKLHTLMDLRGDLPIFIEITDGKVHDVNILDNIQPESNAFYIVDKGYYDFERLYRLNKAEAFFVIRAKRNLQCRRIYSHKVDKTTGLRCDQTIKLTGVKTQLHYSEHLRRIKFYDEEKSKTYVFLTNNFELDALTICLLYKNRWRIELFFKWIKQHLEIKVFWGTSPNAVKTQIWVAVTIYALVAIIRKKLNLELSIYEILQILSISTFDKTPLNQLLIKDNKQNDNELDDNQLRIF